MILVTDRTYIFSHGTTLPLLVCAGLCLPFRNISVDALFDGLIKKALFIDKAPELGTYLFPDG
jgi:hypothetical protein